MMKLQHPRTYSYYIDVTKVNLKNEIESNIIFNITFNTHSYLWGHITNRTRIIFNPIL